MLPQLIAIFSFFSCFSPRDGGSLSRRALFFRTDSENGKQSLFLWPTLSARFFVFPPLRSPAVKDDPESSLYEVLLQADGGFSAPCAVACGSLFLPDMFSYLLFSFFSECTCRY